MDPRQIARLITEDPNVPAEPATGKQFQAVIDVEDRDTAYLYTDIHNAPSDGILCTVIVDPSIPTTELDNEEVALWLANDTYTILKVVPFQEYDFNNPSPEEFNIPSPVILKDKAEYDRYWNSME